VPYENKLTGTADSRLTKFMLTKIFKLLARNPKKIASDFGSKFVFIRFTIFSYENDGPNTTEEIML